MDKIKKFFLSKLITEQVIIERNQDKKKIILSSVVLLGRVSLC